MAQAFVPLERRNRRLMGILLLAAAGMAGMAFAAVPLYSLYCRVTGFGGTTQVADALPGRMADRVVTVRFNADTNAALPWRFQPMDKAVSLRLGAQGMTSFMAENRGVRPTVGTATFNVTPEKAGRYFSKIACFCFDEQVLQPGQRVEMPVVFFVDPAFADDPDLTDTDSIVLSYTFFRAKDEAAVLAQSQATKTISR